VIPPPGSVLHRLDLTTYVPLTFHGPRHNGQGHCAGPLYASQRGQCDRGDWRRDHEDGGLSPCAQDLRTRQGPPQALRSTVSIA
jgi:hypothetical protein